MEDGWKPIGRGATERRQAPTGRAEPYRTLRYRTGGTLQDGWKPIGRGATERRQAPTGRAEPYRTAGSLQDGGKRLQDGWKPTGRLEAYRTAGSL